MNRLSYWAASSAVAVVLMIGLAYTHFAQPILDDWCFPILETSPFDAASELYMTWSGRWPANFLYAVFMSGQSVTSAAYPWLVIWSFPVWFAGFFIVADTAMAGERVAVKAAAALAMLATFWAGAPGTSETFYWAAGNFNYAIPFTLSAGSMALAFRAGGSGFRLAVAMALAFVASMMNELAGIVLAVGATGLLVSFRLERRSLSAPLLILVLSLAGLFVVVLSPGNEVRENVYSAMSVPKLIWTVVRPYESVLSIVADPRILALAVVILVLPKRRPPLERWWLIPVTVILTVAVSVLAVAIATGSAPGFRVLAYLYAVVLGGLFATVWVMPPLKVADGVQAATRFVFAALLLTGPAVAVAIHDLPKAGIWNAQHRAMWEGLSKQKGQEVVVRDYPFYLSMYPDREISTDPNNPANRCMAKVFGLASIRSEGPNGYRWRR